MSFPSKSPKLKALDIIAFDDTELDQYLEKTGRVVSVEDPHNLPEAFIRRLRDRVTVTREGVKSRPVDLDQVAARLQEVTAEDEPSSEPVPPKPRLIEYEKEQIPEREYSSAPSIASTVAFDEEEASRQRQQKEIESYHALVEAGGRPSHPLNLSCDVFKDPGEYHQIVSFWKGSTQRTKALFMSQMQRWLEFRKFQRFMRERDIDDERVIYLYSGHSGSEFRDWYNFVGRQGPVEGEEGRFPMHSRAVKDRLTKHGFLRSFQLDEDPTRQDSLTTWIEYLGYEYWWYDRYALSERQQEWLDSKWQEVLDSQVLKRSETLESIHDRDFEAWMREDHKLKRSREAVETAKAAVISAQNFISDPQNLRHPVEDSGRKLLEAQSELIAAEKNRDFLEHRDKVIGDYIQATANAREFKGNAERHTILLTWILEQLPLIELEMKQSYAAANTLNEGSSKGKRSLRRADRPNPGEGPIGQTKGDKDDPMTLGSLAPTATTTQGSRGRKRSHDILDEEQPSKRPRRSTRNNNLSTSNIPESVTVTVATEVTAEMPPDPSSRAVRKTRQKQRAAIMTAGKGGVAKKADELPNKNASIGKRESKRRKFNNQNRTLSEYDVSGAGDTSAVTKAVNEESQAPQALKTSTSTVRGRKRKITSMARKAEKDVKSNKIFTQSPSLRRQKKGVPFSDPQPSSTVTQPLRRSPRLAQKRAAV
ncbi:hypothetical protein ACJ72_03167 [Emergomyces africanus]|uniref:Uncharacterized protein n=1 Tax=Emergomyces africanus TaxID=1955775 RepID=A0A1B7P0F5_9EURO|nr:hypothetical protein ACJ72_03167 [Emergomyces africanus]